MSRFPDASLTAFHVSILLALLIVVPISEAGITKAQSLFNGRDLTHWSVKSTEADRGKRVWFVESGAIVGRTKSNEHGKVWLYSDGEYNDFRLRLRYQVEEGSACNSGVVLRGRWDESGGGVLHGPQVDISSRGMDGAIYNETVGSREWLKRGDTSAHTRWAPAWNEMEIEFRGLRLRVWINGSLVTDFDGTGLFDDANHRAKQVGSVAGHIGLQVHNNDIMTIRYKDIEITALD